MSNNKINMNFSNTELLVQQKYNQTCRVYKNEKFVGVEIRDTPENPYSWSSGYGPSRWSPLYAATIKEFCLIDKNCLKDENSKSYCIFNSEKITEVRTNGTTYVWENPTFVFNEIAKGKYGSGCYFKSFKNGSAEARINGIDYIWRERLGNEETIYTVPTNSHICIDMKKRPCELCKDCRDKYGRFAMVKNCYGAVGYKTVGKCLYFNCGHYCRDCMDTFDKKFTLEEFNDMYTCEVCNETLQTNEYGQHIKDHRRCEGWSWEDIQEDNREYEMSRLDR